MAETAINAKRLLEFKASRYAAEVLFRRWPGTHWVRLGVSFTGRLDPSWRTHWMYRGLVGRIAWPLIAGRGPYLLWLTKSTRRGDAGESDG